MIAYLISTSLSKYIWIICPHKAALLHYCVSGIFAFDYPCLYLLLCIYAPDHCVLCPVPLSWKCSTRYLIFSAGTSPSTFHFVFWWIVLPQELRDRPFVKTERKTVGLDVTIQLAVKDVGRRHIDQQAPWDWWAPWCYDSHQKHRAVLEMGCVNRR